MNYDNSRTPSNSNIYRLYKRYEKKLFENNFFFDSRHDKSMMKKLVIGRMKNELFHTIGMLNLIWM